MAETGGNRRKQIGREWNRTGRRTVRRSEGAAGPGWAPFSALAGSVADWVEQVGC